MKTRRKLLFLAHTLPYPPDLGVAVRTFNILRQLSGAFEVTVLSFYRARSTPSSVALEDSLAALGELGGVEAFPIPQEHNRVRLVADHLRSLLGRRAYTVPAYESAAFRTRLAEVLRAQHFDLIHMDSLDLSAYLPRVLEAAPVVCTHHNVESMLLRRRAAGEAAWWRRRYMEHQARLMEAEERRWCERVALNVTVSEPDRAELARIAPRARLTVVPNGVDVDTFRPRSGPEHGIVFVGGTDWFPNRDALQYFAEEILPRLRALGEEPPVTWVGRSGSEERERFAREHAIELTGYVEDIRPHVQGAACYVVPLRVGGGTRLKILDAWAMGKAVVSTSVGCEGLQAVDGVNILVRDDPAAFAAAVRDLLQDAALRARLGGAARATAERVYSWDTIGARMVEDYYSLLPERAEDLSDAAPAPGGGAGR